MSLTKYQEKRNFQQTPEPAAQNERSGKSRFVVQEHHATRLHYDFRMETDGVLKSWAVPKGPSMNPKDKRLAVMTEDHPVKYLNFEGTIPKGNYGAGEMYVWDTGTYELEEETSYEKALEAGKVKFTLHGEKLKGTFQLVKLKNSEKNEWLLIKSGDDFAVETDYEATKISPGSSEVKKKRRPRLQKIMPIR